MNWQVLPALGYEEHYKYTNIFMKNKYIIPLQLYPMHFSIFQYQTIPPLFTIFLHLTILENGTRIQHSTKPNSQKRFTLNFRQKESKVSVPVIQILLHNSFLQESLLKIHSNPTQPPFLLRFSRKDLRSETVHTTPIVYLPQDYLGSSLGFQS